MNEQITSAAELDALPVGSVVLDAYAAACTRVRQQDMYDWVRASSAAPNGGKHFHPPYFPATVLYRPDQPQRVQPSREDVVAALKGVWFNLSGEFLGRFADAVLALFSEQPTVAEVKAEALREYAGGLELALAGADPDDFTGYEWVLTLLRNRADGIEAGR